MPKTPTERWLDRVCAHLRPGRHCEAVRRELAAHLDGRLSLDACVELWTRNTRAYAKRQWTWFRADDRILWQRPGEWDVLERRAAEFLHV